MNLKQFIVEKIFRHKPEDPEWKCLTALMHGETRFMPRFFTAQAATREEAEAIFSRKRMHQQEVIERIELTAEFDKIPNSELGVVSNKEMLRSSGL